MDNISGHLLLLWASQKKKEKQQQQDASNVWKTSGKHWLNINFLKAHPTSVNWGFCCCSCCCSSDTFFCSPYSSWSFNRNRRESSGQKFNFECWGRGLGQREVAASSSRNRRWWGPTGIFDEIEWSFTSVVVEEPKKDISFSSGCCLCHSALLLLLLVGWLVGRDLSRWKFSITYGRSKTEEE